MSEQLTYAEIKRRLRKPIEKQHIDFKTQGGAKIAFVNITTLKDILDERLAGSHWEALIKSTIVCGDNLIMVVSLVIHASDGVYCQDGTGIESINLRGYGDVASNSYAQAYRRAAESHGLGRELWRMELSDEQKEIVKEDAKPPMPTRIKNITKALEESGITVEPQAAGETENDYFQSLVDQWNKLAKQNNPAPALSR